MKVLIMSITAGEGHNSTARAIKEYLESHDVTCKVLDTYGYISNALKKIVSEGYLFTSGKVKFAYSKGYRLAEKRHANSEELSAARIANMAFTKKIHRYIEEYAPDVIVYTHPFAGIIIDLLKQKKSLNITAIGVVTDFTMHPYWEECLHTDYVICATEMLKYQAQRKGFKPEQIIASGIPIHPKFAKSEEKTVVRQRLGLDPNCLTILLMGGSMGYGNMAQSVEKLDQMEQDFQLIAVCGNNAKAKASIEEKTFRHPMLVLGFVSNIDELMDASDCIVTKPGGLTTSEALAKRLPMIIVNPIPGQEMRNVEFLLNCGAAMAVSKTCSLDEIMHILMQNPARLETMRNSIDLVRKPNSTQDVGDLVLRCAQNQH